MDRSFSLGEAMVKRPSAAAQGGWYGRKVPFGFAPNMNDNILYHALAD